MKFNLKKYSNISTKDYWERDLNEILDGINYAHNKHKFSISLLQDMHSKRLLSGKFSDDDFKKAIEKINIGINSAFIRFILSNPNCPVNLLIEVIEEYGKKYINEIFNNSNFPIDLKIEYSKKLGLVTEEDKNTHILEERKEENKDLGKRENKDLENFRSLLGNSFSNSFNLKRYSQDRNMLRNQDILRLPDSLGDNLSFIENQLNFTEDPDRIRVILDKYHNNYHYNNGTLFYFATENRNCPEDVIIKAFYVCKDHKFNMTKLGVIRHIVNSINTPPDILELILDGDFSNSIQNIAALNPNCPPDSKIKHLKDSGEITREDKDKHILEEVKEVQKEKRVDKQENNDLENFRSLLGNSFSNSFNLRRYSQDDKFSKLLKDPYNIAKNSSDPNELRKVIQNNSSERFVIFTAVINKHCPLDALISLWSSDKYQLDKQVNYAIANRLVNNTECPSEVLDSIIFNVYMGNEDIKLRVAQHRNCNDILISNILLRTHYGTVATAALKNKNCTNEAIKYALENIDPHDKGYIIEAIADFVSDIEVIVSALDIFRSTSTPAYNYFLENKNCNAEILREEYFLIGGQKSRLSSLRAIVENNNCPSDVIELILQNNLLYDDGDVKLKALQNPNCSEDAKINFYKRIGKITTEDKEKHILENVKEENNTNNTHNRQEENKDIDKFRSLLND